MAKCDRAQKIAASRKWPRSGWCRYLSDCDESSLAKITSSSHS